MKGKQRKEDEEGNVLRVKRGGGRTETRSLPFAGRSGERKEQGEGDGGGEREKQEGWKDGYAEKDGCGVWGRDGRRDGRRNVTDGSCLARAGRERRGWQHRVRERTQTHTIHTIAARVHACAPDNSSHALGCQECFPCLSLCQENVDI